MIKKKVLVSDSLSEHGLQILRQAGLEVDVITGMKPEELKACIAQYHGIVIRSATKVTSEIIDAADNLKVIGRAGSGLDNVDRAAATKKGIVVMNTPGGNTITTAEHTIAMLFSMARMIPQATGSMKEGKWEKKRFMGVELYNKTLGVVGIGNIGREVAKRAQCMGMNVLAFDPFLVAEAATAMNVEKVSVEDLFRRADFITIHTPMTAETKGLVNKNSIATMKDGVRIINCARGGIINEADLLDALNSGKVGGAALDVFEIEPPVGNPLIGHERVVTTPHLGASTGEAQENVAVAVAEQVVDYLVHDVIRNAVNFPSIPHDQVPKLSPYIALAESLGTFASQLVEGGAKEITIEYRGEAAELTNPDPVKIAALKGFLTPILEETVNFINAPMIAKERGIEVRDMRSAEAGDYHTMLILKVKAGGVERSFAGTLFGRREPRITKVDGFPVEIYPEGTMLIMGNNDKPGVIGNIGNTLGKYGVNIARMHFGRESAGGRAITVASIDAVASPELIEEIRNLPNIVSVKQVHL